MSQDVVTLSILTMLITLIATIVFYFAAKGVRKYIKLRNEQNGHVYVVAYKLLGERRPGSDKQRMFFDAKILRAHSGQEAAEKTLQMLLEKCYLKSQIEIGETVDVNDDPRYWRVRDVG